MYNEHALGFTVYDMNNLSNYENYPEKCITFNSSNLYHFSPVNLSTSYSCFALITDEKIQYW